MMRGLVAVLMAYAVALGAAWFTQAQVVGALFTPGAEMAVWRTVVLPPLAGLAVFALIFGLLAGAMPRWRYWLFGSTSVAVLYGLAVLAIHEGVAGPAVALTVALLLLLGLAFVTLARRV